MGDDNTILAANTACSLTIADSSSVGYNDALTKKAAHLPGDGLLSQNDDELLNS